MNALFAYGTLICSDIMKDVSGLDVRGEPAKLEDFRRGLVRGEVFPAILPAPGHCVQGVVYQPITKSAWSRLDDFEGDIYERQAVNVRLSDGRMLSAGTYVIVPPSAHLLTNRKWDLDHFLLYGKARFTNDYQGYSSLPE